MDIETVLSQGKAGGEDGVIDCGGGAAQPGKEANLSAGAGRADSIYKVFGAGHGPVISDSRLKQGRAVFQKGIRVYRDRGDDRRHEIRF